MSQKPAKDLQLDSDQDLSRPIPDALPKETCTSSQKSPSSTKSPGTVASLLMPLVYDRDISLPPVIPQPPGCVPMEGSPSPYWEEGSPYAEKNVFQFDPEHIDRVTSSKKSLPISMQPCNSSIIRNRRGAICEEVEKAIFPAKINGVWMSLSDLRADMIRLRSRHNKNMKK